MGVISGNITGAWFDVEGLPDGFEDWESRCFIADDGCMYFPVSVFTDEVEAIVVAASAQEPIAVRDGHAYLRTEFIIAQFPEFREMVQATVNKLLAFKRRSDMQDIEKN